MSLLLRNSRIWTGDRMRPWAGSISIRGGRIAGLDTDADAEDVIDAEGRTALPGLIDTHLHLILGGRSLGELDLTAVRSRDEFEAAIAARHETLEEDRWLIARGWSNEYLPGHENPDKSWLAGAGTRPVVCHRVDMHAVLVNDAVLERCDTTHDPPGGRIDRDPDGGRPTGLLVEAAAWQLINPLIPKPDPPDVRRTTLAACEHLLACGVTAVGTMEYSASLRDVLVPLRDRLGLRCRVILLDRGWPMDFDLGRRFARHESDEQLGVIGYKAFIDGTLGSRTARMLADYADDPGNRGLLVELGADGNLGAWAHAVAATGLMPVMHAIGDEAVRVALDVIATLNGRAARIEHAQHVDQQDLPRFRGVMAAMQPLHKADDGCYAQRRLGTGRLDGFFAFRSLLEAGACLGFGSDWPVVSCDPMQGIRAAVTGLTVDGDVVAAGQNLSIAEALIAYTRDAANAVTLEHGGVLRPGALGDLVILNRDPFSADWVNEPPEVVMTIVGGRVVYDSR